MKTPHPPYIIDFGEDGPNHEGSANRHYQLLNLSCIDGIHSQLYCRDGRVYG